MKTKSTQTTRIHIKGQESVIYHLLLTNVITLNSCVLCRFLEITLIGKLKGFYIGQLVY